MIICLLDGKKAYPVNTDKIKVTYENQFVKDSGSYTYDISFPLDIPENRKVFGNVQRMDVKKNLADFEDCRLYADNRLIMSGKGTGHVHHEHDTEGADCRRKEPYQVQLEVRKAPYR